MLILSELIGLNIRAAGVSPKHQQQVSCGTWSQLKMSALNISIEVSYTLYLQCHVYCIWASWTMDQFEFSTLLQGRWCVAPCKAYVWCAGCVHCSHEGVWSLLHRVQCTYPQSTIGTLCSHIPQAWHWVDAGPLSVQTCRPSSFWLITLTLCLSFKHISCTCKTVLILRCSHTDVRRCRHRPAAVLDAQPQSQIIVVAMIALDYPCCMSYVKFVFDSCGALKHSRT